MTDYSKEELIHALKESLKLQSHYAGLLNMYDNGRRMQFDTTEKWINRLRFIKQDREKNHGKL